MRHSKARGSWPAAAVIAAGAILLGGASCCRASPPGDDIARSASPASPAAAPPPVRDAAVDGFFIPPPADVARAPADAVRTSSGLAMRVVTPGAATRHPGKTDIVEIVYAGWRRDGQFFEGTPDSAPVRLERASLIPGLDEGLGLMVEGEKRRLWIPFAQAYGARPEHVNAPQEDLTYDVELRRIISPPATPADVARVPRSGVTRTKSGLVYRILKRGPGQRHPTDEAWVQLEQATWTPDGRLVYSSRRAGDWSRVRVSQLTPGWREAMLLMVEGDKLRLWLPGKLAFGDPIPGQGPLPFAPPLGPLVMDVELVRIED